MTASVQPTATRRPMLAILALVLVALAGAGVGACLDWRWWHPTSGIVVTIGAIGVLLVGTLAWVSRWRPIRPLAYAALAFGIGMILGQNLGPSRPPITLVAGTVTIELTEPANAAPITGRADCQQTPGGENFEISGDPNLRIQIGDQPRQVQDPFQLALARGDMWEYGLNSRSDGWSLLVVVGEAGPIADDAFPAEVSMASDRDSEIAAVGTQARGTLSFSGLVLHEQRSPDATGPIDVAGTISWVCDPETRMP